MTALPSVPRPDVARAFGLAAEQYDTHAALQRRVADWLLEQVTQAAAIALDLGCGTGYCLARLPAFKRIGIDISAPMLATARQKLPQADFIQGDAEALPLPSHSVDLLVSSLALQWCLSLDKALLEAQRVLAPGGRLLIALPMAGSLFELAEAWGGGQGHLLPLPEPSAVRALLPPGASLVLKDFVCHFADLKALRQSLKGIGAHQVPGRARGLTGKASYRQFLAGLEAQRTERGLPLTYRIGLIQWQNASS
ncbi:methyltransferase domain-containing protein [Gallaecimonas kandeliae]|uniref:methyltransferase domain-containing protein n=1 Tax=Gallaecimonas kandeliae TaxID=3029055 RepID=UPI0026486A33|nr:methyltransferase domain-containing protein [Gallaecimonas kandeliae]WKE67410.1 methyltransferase domain-containing protein [Gallaecimonas kandeliae]